ncbi:MAG: LLM class flavin-dependent oxidoreductase [Paracoccaceae bacterium]
MSTLELGIDTFGDVSEGADGRLKPMDAVLRDVVEEAVWADQLGIDFIGLGEHHRDDFAISAPEMVLATVAGRTRRIKLGTAVTILSTDDPVRVFQRFSTLHALSNGRAEPILGRGSFTESYDLFGYDLGDYEALFEEKLGLFTQLLRDERVTWAGETRPPLRSTIVYPRLGQPMTAWVGVGGSPQSVIRVARHDLQMMLAIIGGDPLRFRPLVDLYHRALGQLGQAARPIGVHAPGFIAASDDEAREALWPHYQAMFGRIGRERGWGPVTKEHYLNEVENGALFVGAPETVAQKIARTVSGLGLGRFDLKYSTGPMPHGQLLECLRLYGERVIPMVRDLLG